MMQKGVVRDRFDPSCRYLSCHYCTTSDISGAVSCNKLFIDTIPFWISLPIGTWRWQLCLKYAQGYSLAKKGRTYLHLSILLLRGHFVFFAKIPSYFGKTFPSVAFIIVPIKSIPCKNHSLATSISTFSIRPLLFGTLGMGSTAVQVVVLVLTSCGSSPARPRSTGSKYLSIKSV